MKSSLTCTLENINLSNKNVFLRADLNVPINNGIITNDFKLKAACPTIDLLLKKNAHIVLATHLGRPQKQDADFSTKHLIGWFEEHGYNIIFAKSPQKALQKQINQSGKIILLENLRFFPGEQAQSKAFAQELYVLGSVYVNDAFGALHRNDTSLTLLPALYQSNVKTIGLLVQKELTHLAQLVDNPKKPFVIILGGKKIKTKLPFLETMLQKTDTILLCPALVFTLLAAQKKSIGQSLIDTTMIEKATKLLSQPNAKNIILPKDFQIIFESITGPVAYTQNQNIPADAIGTAIGPKSIALFIDFIKNAKTLFFNGPMGFEENPKTMLATYELLNAIGNSNAYSVIGGGDSIAAALHCKAADKVNFLSTGGGSTLAFIAGQKLPGLEYMH